MKDDSDVRTDTRSICLLSETVKVTVTLVTLVQKRASPIQTSQSSRYLSTVDFFRRHFYCGHSAYDANDVNELTAGRYGTCVRRPVAYSAVASPTRSPVSAAAMRGGDVRARQSRSRNIRAGAAGRPLTTVSTF